MTEWNHDHVFSRIEHWAWIAVYAVACVVLIWIAITV